MIICSTDSQLSGCEVSHSVVYSRLTCECCLCVQAGPTSSTDQTCQQSGNGCSTTSESMLFKRLHRTMSKTVYCSFVITVVL